jgi:hypothetical protein
LQPGAGPYYFGLSVVNVQNLGSVVSVEARLSSDGSDEWVALERDPNYTMARPQERTGDWVLPQGAGPFSVPLTLRITDPSGQALIAQDAIKSWAPDAGDPTVYFIDTGVQF